ncbi:MAG: amidohydrolase family protein [Phycisphaerales bacterium]
MKRMNSVTMMAAGVMCALTAAAGAQDLGVKAPKQTVPIVIDNATIHTVSGEVIERGHVVLNNGKINEVGAGSAPSLASKQVIYIDAAGKHVYPGLVSANTLMGVTEIGSIDVTQDYAELGTVTPEAKVAVAVNPDSTIIPVTRSNGILTAAVLPMGGVIPGHAAVLRMDGWTWEDLSLEPDAGLMINWPSMRTFRAPWMRTSEEDQQSRVREQVARIDSVFDDAVAYFASVGADANIADDLRYDGMRAVLDGGKPVFIRAGQREQIESAVLWAVGRGLRPVIVGGADAEECAELLKRHDVGVIITGTLSEPSRRDEAYDAPFTLPARLEAAGVKWCLAGPGGSFETPHERNLPYHAAMAVAYGLDHDRAIEAITLSAAELLGVSDRVGSLEVGKNATLIVTDGDPLEITTNVELAFIEGRAIDLGNKQTALAEKYREKYRQLGLIEGDAEGAESHGGSGIPVSR